jgi:hypothetical protein
MASHTFFIPCRGDFWEVPYDPLDPTGKESARWISLECARILKLAERLFPDVQFFISEAPPASQTYQRGSINQDIREVLERNTSIRFVPLGRGRQP